MRDETLIVAEHRSQSRPATHLIDRGVKLTLTTTARERAAAIRRAVRDAFYVDADDWKGMILGQFRAFALQTINGLSAS